MFYLKSLGLTTTSGIKNKQCIRRTISASARKRIILCLRLGNDTSDVGTGGEISELDYDHLADETLETLAEHFDSLPEYTECPSDFDVTFSQGVLTVNVGGNKGMYVINKQTPNRQIWLSSPLSGPKRYDYVERKWVCKHNGADLQECLTKEFRQLLNSDNISIPR